MTEAGNYWNWNGGVCPSWDTESKEEEKIEMIVKK